MFSKFLGGLQGDRVWLAAAAAVLAGFQSTHLSAQIYVSPDPISIENNVVCTQGAGLLVVSDSYDVCNVATTQIQTLTIGNSPNDIILDGATGMATFNGPVNLEGLTQLDGLQGFSGTTTFNSTVSFIGPSVTFDTGATFNSSANFAQGAGFGEEIATQGIVNIGTIGTTTINSFNSSTGALLVSDSVTLLGGAAVDMGGNQIHNVAAGTAPTDAATVGQIEAANGALQTNIDNETTARTTADTTLQDNIDTEATTRAAADTVLQNNIDSEASTRAAADTDLRTDIMAVASDLGTETTARIAADEGFETRIDALQQQALQFTGDLKRLDRKLAGSTAVAVAMSGNAFLPDKQFNLTGNIATYDGAYAGALQIGAMVSRNAAFNAAVAKNFNKRGKTAARVGFTVGW